MSGSKSKGQYQVPPSQMITPVFMEYPMGLFMGKFMRELKQNARLVGMVCRQCGHTMFPPQALCSVCHGENFQNPQWVEVGPKATVAGLMEIKMPWLNPWTLTLRSSQYPVGILMVDAPGSSPGVIWHFIGETDVSKLRVGMRVKAVFKPREEREGLMEDIVYWAPIEE
jgi:uncharacterized OB-fold protein